MDLISVPGALCTLSSLPVRGGKFLFLVIMAAPKEDALTKTYDLMLWLFPQIGKFPREYRFILGDRLENGLIDLCEALIEARFTRNKGPILKNANIRLEKLRYLVRLCKDLKLLSLKKYEYLAKELNSIGVFVGGWIKSLAKRKGSDETVRKPV